MSTTMTPLTERPAWKALVEHYQKTQHLHLRKLFADDPKRGERFAAEAAGIYLDYSKNRVNGETMRLLLELAESSGLRARIDAMFRGEKINVTENRAVLHVALRAPRDQHILVDGEDVVPQVHAVLDKMANFSERVRSGAWTGYTGKRMRNIVNIGIGGSDLGPSMAYDALKYYSDRHLTVRFVSNVDGVDFVEAIGDLQNLHDTGDIDQRTLGSRVVRQRSGQHASGRQTLCRRFNKHARGGKVWHRYRQHVRVLGLGWWPLLLRFGYRAFPDDRHWP